MYLQAIKAAARISHGKLDGELERLEKYACAELIRAGVPKEETEKEQPLIENAVVAYALSEISEEKTALRAAESWEYQKDALRKHGWNGGEANV